MGYPLYREIRDRAPAQWTAGERLVALMIADHADDNTRKATRLPLAGYRRERDGRWVDGLTDRTGLGAAGVSKALQRLAARGFEFRIPISVGKDGRPVFAAKGHALDFTVPVIPQRADHGPPFERADQNPAFEQRADCGPANSAKGRTVVRQRADGGPPPFPQVPSEELFPQVHHHARAREAQRPSAAERGNRLLQEHIDAHQHRPPRELIRQTASAIKILIADEAAYTDDHIRAGLAKWRDKPHLSYRMLPALVNEAINAPTQAGNGHRPAGRQVSFRDEEYASGF